MAKEFYQRFDSWFVAVEIQEGLYTEDIDPTKVAPVEGYRCYLDGGSSILGILLQKSDCDNIPHGLDCVMGLLTCVTDKEFKATMESRRKSEADSRWSLVQIEDSDAGFARSVSLSATEENSLSTGQVAFSRVSVMTAKAMNPTRSEICFCSQSLGNVRESSTLVNFFKGSLSKNGKVPAVRRRNVQGSLQEQYEGKLTCVPDESKQNDGKSAWKNCEDSYQKHKWFWLKNQERKEGWV